jgi:hypothetical protein
MIGPPLCAMFPRARLRVIQLAAARRHRNRSGGLSSHPTCLPRGHPGSETRADREELRELVAMARANSTRQR